MIDGRLLATCHAAEKIATSSHGDEITFDGFKIIPLADVSRFQLRLHLADYFSDIMTS